MCDLLLYSINWYCLVELYDIFYSNLMINIHLTSLTLTIISSNDDDAGAGKLIQSESTFLFTNCSRLDSSRFWGFKNVLVCKGGNNILLLDWMSNLAVFETSVRLVTALALLSNGIIRRPSLAHSCSLFGPQTLYK